MSFDEIVEAAIALLRRRQRLTYGTLKRQFGLDDDGLEDLKQELILGQRVAQDEAGLVLVWQDNDAAAPAAAATPAAQAELRQLTIMFCDLADSTSLSNALDVEDLRAVLRAFQDAAGEAVARHDGFVNSYMGDGILTFFGYPQAHEDDARCAVRAGLDVVAAVGALKTPAGAPLRVRVGIATGVVVAGDIIGKGASREEAVVGSTSNLAARLQSVAQPGQVVIAAATRRLLGPGFEVVDLGPQRLKGFDQPVAAWRVLAERAPEADGQPGTEADGQLPMVDREVEFPALMHCWRQACAGQPRLVTLRGEAGLGKTRLCDAVREAVHDGAAGQDHQVLRFYCWARFQNTALYPVIRHLRHAAGFDDDDSDDTRLDRLEALLQQSLSTDEASAAMPCFAALLSVPLGQRYAPLLDSPERQREQTLQALCTLVLAMARQRPVLMLFEDLHWADPTTLTLIGQLAHQVDDQRLMVLATGRPEFEPPWSDLPQAVTVPLSLLKRHDRTRIVEQHAGTKPLPPEMLEHIVQKSDGIPLYVEELTKAMLESGLLREEADRFVLTGPMRATSVPSTLQDSLLARLDRLAVAKEVAQAGAAIGREFSHQTLAALLPMSPAELNASVARLIDAGLIQSRGLPPDAVYMFKHALIQDAAYATMLRPRRQGLHARIAQVLQADPSVAQRTPELLAHHLVQADQVTQALPHLLAAGLNAAAAAAHTEACRHFNEGLRLLQALPEDTPHRRLELRLRVHLGMSLAATQGYASPEVEATQQRARALCEQEHDPDEMYWVLRGLCAMYLVRADAPAARELSDQCTRLAQQTGRDEFLVEALVMEGYVQGYFGDLARARQALSQAVHVYRHTDACHFAYPTPQDPCTASLVMLAMLEMLQGDQATALAHIDDALQAAEARRRPFDQAWAHCWAALVNNLRRDFERAAHHAGVAMEISQRHGFNGWLAAGAMHLGVAKAELGAPQEAVALVGGTLPAWVGSGAELNCCFFRSGLVQAHRAAGEFELALLQVDQALAQALARGEHWYNAALRRQRAELLLHTGQTAAAEAGLRDAMAIARRQGAHTLELRAAAVLARLLMGAARHDEARQVLDDALPYFAQQPDNLDLIEARTLLAEIAAAAG
jgi:class 3 adenylate cyclase/predicted ATPase